MNFWAYGLPVDLSSSRLCFPLLTARPDHDRPLGMKLCIHTYAIVQSHKRLRDLYEKNMPFSQLYFVWLQFVISLIFFCLYMNL